MKTLADRKDSSSKHGLPILALSLTLTLLSPPPLVASPRSEAEGWIALSGSHFTVFSDSEPRKAEQIARELEAFGAVIQRMYPGLSVEPLRPTHVFLINSRSSFKKLSPSSDGQGSLEPLPPALAQDAFVANRAEASYLVVNAGSSGLAAHFALFHHYTHHVLSQNYPDMPLWLNEGLATYFAPFLLAQGKALFGDPLWLHRLRPQRWISLEQALLTTARSEEYLDPDKHQDFKSQAWMLVHYLFDLEDGRRQRTLEALSLLAAGESSAQALTQAYGQSLEQLEAAVRKAYLLAKDHAQSIRLRDLDIRQDFIVRPLKVEEALCRLGDLLLLGGKEPPATADAYFDEVLKISPNDACALTGKGAVRLSMGEPEKALAFLERAIELEPSARSYYLLGNALLEKFDAEDGRMPTRDKPSPPLVIRARGAYQQALQQDPKFLDAYNQLGKTYVYDSGPPQPGIELMERVLARVPTVSSSLTLIELHSRGGNRDAARTVHDQHLVRLVDAMHHTPVGWVDRALIRADLIVADVWAEQGRAQDALALAREADGKTDDEKLEQEIADKIRAYSSKITTVAAVSPADIWWRQMRSLCHQAFTGALTSKDAVDAAFAEQTMTMHTRSCDERRLEVAFNVGENRSRTWVITRTDQGLRLQHDHRHEDGSEDAVSLYGGYANAGGTDVAQHFPADSFSKQLFEANGLEPSVANVWSMEVVPGERFTYILRRPERHFQVDFDLTRAVDPPPASWGHE